MNVRAMAAQALLQPMLSADEERALTRRVSAGDDVALGQLVTAFSRVAVKIAAENRHYGLPPEDLVQEGNVGLLIAARKFDPERGIRFRTYADWWVRAAITDFIARNVSVVRMGNTVALKNLFFKVRRAWAKLEAADPGIHPRDVVAQLAVQFGVSPAAVERAYWAQLAGDERLDNPVGVGATATHLDYLADERPLPGEEFERRQERQQLRTHLSDAVGSLKERDRRIFVARRLAARPRTLVEVGGDLGISRERARQIEERAFKAVAAHMRQAVFA